MALWKPETIEVTSDFSGLDTALETVPNRQAVFAVWPREGLPYIARTSLLRRRLYRLLGERPQPTRLLNLRSVASRVEFRLTASWLETSLIFYELARQYFPEKYLRLLKLRMPPYVKIVLTNPFPRSQVTTRISGAKALYFGPFRTRIGAEQFESQFLNLFQMRRCQEDLDPSPGHPGCIYGEMNMCLRPCQQVVGPEEYRSEVDRVLQFLATDGRSLVETLTHARDRLSEELNFEEAARQHKQLEEVQQVLRLRDELVREIDRLHGVAVTPSVQEDCVELWFVISGCWQPPQRFGFEVIGGKTISMDQRLREVVASLKPRQLPLHERQEHLALLARWRYASHSDGEWLPFQSIGGVPYRKLVRAISRVAEQSREKAK
jgi:excinuclease ABC subunit C